MSRKSENNSFFEDLKAGLEEGIRFLRGELDLRTFVPPPPPEMKAKEIIRLRQRCEMSEQQFAQVLKVSTKTVRSWEQGTRRTGQSALNLLHVLKVWPEILLQAEDEAPRRHKAGAKKRKSATGRKKQTG